MCRQAHPSSNTQETTAGTHPFAPLRHRNEAEEIGQSINNLYYSKLSEIENIIKSISATPK